MTTLYETSKTCSRATGRSRAAVVVTSGRWVASTRSCVARQWYEVRPPRRTPRHGSNYGEIEIEIDYQPPKKLQSFGKGLFLDADARSLNLLGALFDRCDTSQNGELDRDEFRRLYAKLETSTRSTLLVR